LDYPRPLLIYNRQAYLDPTHLWEHYLFTGDRQFLADRAYPVLKGAGEFFLDYMYTDRATSVLMTGPSVSPERGGECRAGFRAFRKEHILLATLTDASGQVLARTDALVDNERRLTFPAARLTVTVETDHLVITTEFYASQGKDRWGEPIAAGTFARNAKVKSVIFDNPVKARYIRFVAVKGFEGQKWASMAELRLIPVQ
jgi:hypothetical protein